jgi:gliding motility-associated-like protein
MEHNHIDKVFKNAAENASFSPPEGLWNNIAQQLPTSNPILNPPANDLVSSLANLSTLVKTVIAVTAIAAVSIPIVITNQSKTENNNIEVQQEIELKAENIQTNKVQENTQVEENIKKVYSENLSETNNQAPEFSKPIFHNSKSINFEIPKLTVDVVANSSNCGFGNAKHLFPDEINMNGSHFQTSTRFENTKNKINLGDTFVCGPQQSFSIYQILRTNNNNKVYIEYLDTLLLLEELAPYSMNYVFKVPTAEGIKKILVGEVLEKEGQVRLVSKNELQNSITQRRVIYKQTKKADILANELNDNDLLVELYTIQVVSEITWYLNDEFYSENMKQFVYNRNLEMSQHQNLKIKAVYLTQYGCIDSSESMLNGSVSFTKEPEFANVFTPNGDGKNDYWFVQIEGEEKYNLRIFDVYQNLLFESTNKEDKWDGKDRNGNRVEAGTYYFQLSYKMPTKENKQKTGHIVLIR